MIWHGQQAGFPREWAQTLIPPPDNIVRTILNEFGEFSSPALVSPSCRRAIRQQCQAVLEAHFKEIYCAPKPLWDGIVALLGVDPDSKQHSPKKLKEIEAETKQELAALEEHPEDLEEYLPAFMRGKAHEVVALLAEFSLGGEVQPRPKVRRNSAIWRILGVRPEQLDDLSSRVVAMTVSSVFLRIFGLIGSQANELKVRQFFRWALKTHIRGDCEKSHSPEALAKAVNKGLIHRGYVFKEDEYSEPDVELEDTEAEESILTSVENRDELQRLIERVDPPFTKAERCTLDGMFEGREGFGLRLWAKEHGFSPSSAPELRSRILHKLRKTART